MRHHRIWLIGTASACAMMLASPAMAQRAETSLPAQVFARDTCLLTPPTALAAERNRTAEFIGPLLASIFAGFTGNLVQSGVNAIGDALDTASREQGFVAEGTAPIRMGKIDPGESVSETATFRPTEQCLSLYMPSGEGVIDDLFSDPVLAAHPALAAGWQDEEARAALANEFAKEGMTSLPALYAEAVLLPGKEGFIVRPTLVWYRTVLKGAPRRTTAAEMQILFAVPGFDAAKPGIGTEFAGARLALPPLAPGTLLDWNRLQGSRSVWLPLRPTTGAVDARLQAINTAKTLVGTRSVELAKGEKALAAAQRSEARKPGPDAAEATLVAQEGRDEAAAALEKARVAASGKESVPAGATNLQMRVVIVRDANKFGQAIAKALKSQAEAAGKGVTEGLTSQPDWAASDTGYLTAMIAVENKQRAYDDAVAEGEAAAIVTASNELKLAQAKANEAAVAAKKDLPFPALLEGL